MNNYYEFVKRNLPNLELSFETILQKKVHTDIYIGIPKGERVLAWFTCYKSNDMCLLLYLDRYNKVKKVEDTILCFDRKLSYGTILYGTFFIEKNIRYFTCEDIYYYKNKYIKSYIYKEKLGIIKNIFDNELKQIRYNNSFIIFGLPIIDTNFNRLIESIQLLPYQIRTIQLQDWSSINELKMIIYKAKITKECIFKVRADIEADIYSLYGSDSKYKPYSYACVSSYKTSVMMNKLFRNIKENANLDLLEESDNDEDFENVNPNKYVDLNKELYISCIYNKKFRKWVPCKVINTDKNMEKKLLSDKDIYALEIC